MRGREILDTIENLNPAYIEAAAETPKAKKKVWLKLGAMVACLCLFVSSTASALVASGPAFYNILYAISPATAQFFKPIQLSCIDNGIRMEVIATYIHEDTAEIYISMQDLEETRFDETIDLFDSYRINSPFDCTGYCKLSSYDLNTQTATFLVTIEQWNKRDIVGDKLTFVISELLSNKKTYEGIIDNVILNKIELNNVTQIVCPRGLGGITFSGEHASAKEELIVLKPVGAISSPIDGVTITGIGYVDGNLHVQVYYENILKTDNHGSIALSNTITGEMVASVGSISFFDDAGTGSEYAGWDGAARPW